MKESTRGNWLLAGQAACELAMLLPGRRLWRNSPAVKGIASVLIGSGITVGAAGAGALGQHLRLHPLPPPGAALRTRGVYRIVRHPIYLGILAAATGMALLRARLASIIAVTTMTAVLSSKAACEEQALLREFGSRYRRYCSDVPRGLPPAPWIREAGDAKGPAFDE